MTQPRLSLYDLCRCRCCWWLLSREIFSISLNIAATSMPIRCNPMRFQANYHTRVRNYALAGMLYTFNKSGNRSRWQPAANKCTFWLKQWTADSTHPVEKYPLQDADARTLIPGPRVCECHLSETAAEIASEFEFAFAFVGQETNAENTIMADDRYTICRKKNQGRLGDARMLYQKI